VKSRVSSVILAAVFVSAAISTAPRLSQLVQQSLELAPLDYEERRTRLIAEYYPSLQTIRAATNNQPLALIAFTPLDWDRAFFAAYYLYPQPTRPFLHYEHYRDSPVKSRYPRLVALNLHRDPRLRLATYDEIVEESAPPPVISQSGAALHTGARFIVPLTLSLYGPIPHDYRTEAVLATDVPATVTMTFNPRGAVRTRDLLPGQPLRIGDVAMEVFGVKGTGWVSVSATAPIRASFWFVNRGTRYAAPIPLMSEGQRLPRRFEGGERLWIINPAEKAVSVTVNNRPVTLAPHGIHIDAAAASTTAMGSEPVIVFTSQKLPSGEVEFRW
jgi:hypothetical protein